MLKKMLQLNSILQRFLPASLTAVALLLGLAAFGQQNGDKTYLKTTKKGTAYQVMGWETEVIYNPYTYTWQTWQDPVVKTEEYTKTTMVPLSEFDRPPVFDGICLTKETPEAMFECSNQGLVDYVQKRTIEYPEAARFLTQDGLEYVTFTVDKDGKIKDNIVVVSKKDPCQGCEEAAADIVASMEDKWYPAILNGKTVNTRLTIPIRFDMDGNGSQ